MENQRRSFIPLYLLIVAIPTLIFGIAIFLYGKKNIENENIEDTVRLGNLYESYLSEFISDTVISLETISFSSTTVIQDLTKLKPLLIHLEQKDERYDSFYVFGEDGTFQTSSKPNVHTELKQIKPFISTVIKQQDIMISPSSYTNQVGDSIVALAVPTFNENKHLHSILVSMINLDYIQEIFTILTPHTKLMIHNENKEAILTLNIAKDRHINLHEGDWLTVPINNLPWTIHIRIPEPDFSKKIWIFLSYFVAVVIILHLLFMIILKMIDKWDRKKLQAEYIDISGTVAAIAHEIKNPLTGINGLVQLLSEKYKDKTDQFYFSVIREEINRMNKMTSDFLLVGKQFNHQLIEENLVQILKEIEPIIRAEAKEKQITVCFFFEEEEMNIKCAKEGMKQVVLNIAKNGIESMDNGGTLTINLKKKKGHCDLSITDNGIGMTKEQVDKIFTPFYTSKNNGTGLGLFICKQIIQSFNGTIQIESEEMIGTTVTISLPIINRG